ncbi:hypothetical protein GCM10011392_11490 [Wenxinia marina]|nr:hypothetical protein GCM10011392_11490 [Wenxinia marina]
MRFAADLRADGPVQDRHLLGTVEAAHLEAASARERSAGRWTAGESAVATTGSTCATRVVMTMRMAVIMRVVVPAGTVVSVGIAVNGHDATLGFGRVRPI